MNMTTIYPIVLFFSLFNSALVLANCNSVVRESPEGVVLVSQSLEDAIYAVTSKHENIDLIINEVLKLQKSLLINKVPLEELTRDKIEKGFLVGEKQPDRLKKLLIEYSSELVLICSKIDDSLAGYAIVTPISEFESAYINEEDGVFKPSIPIEKWIHFATNREHRYIHQIAVRPDLRGKGIGTSILNVCKSMSPKGLLADILFEPSPYNNIASYNLFLKNDFKDVGTLFIKHFPAFQPCKTHVVMWNGGL